eukprot:11469943-Ditylum_brightwellii.AAC.1
MIEEEEEDIAPATQHLPAFDTEHDDLLPLKESTIKCFAKPGDTYLAQTKANEISICLTYFVTEKFTTKATEVAQRAVGNKPTVNCTHISDLFKQQLLH